MDRNYRKGFLSYFFINNYNVIIIIIFTIFFSNFIRKKEIYLNLFFYTFYIIKV